MTEKAFLNPDFFPPSLFFSLFLIFVHDGTCCHVRFEGTASTNSKVCSWEKTDDRIIPIQNLLLPPFSHTPLLFPCFAPQDFTMVHLFYLPPSIHAVARDSRHCVRESACGRGTQENRSTKIFGHVRVRTLSACMADECFIHCARPLGPNLEPRKSNQ